jgi:hypothetical protein
MITSQLELPPHNSGDVIGQSPTFTEIYLTPHHPKAATAVFGSAIGIVAAIRKGVGLQWHGLAIPSGNQPIGSNAARLEVIHNRLCPGLRQFHIIRITAFAIGMGLDLYLQTGIAHKQGSQTVELGSRLRRKGDLVILKINTITESVKGTANVRVTLKWSFNCTVAFMGTNCSNENR